MPIQNLCPWSELSPGYFPLCEARLCAWISQPANTYSNLIFFIIGAYLFYLGLKKRSPNGLSFGVCTLFIGTASFLAHASGARIFGFFDFVAIFAALSLYLARNFVYVYRDDRALSERLLFLAFFIPSSLIIYFAGFLREIIFAAFVIGLIVWEFRILKRQRKPVPTPSQKKLLAVFLLGVIFLAADAGRIICDEHDHVFQMHALWHICNAFVFYFLTKHLDEHRPPAVRC